MGVVNWVREVVLAMGLVFALEGILLAGLTDSMKKRLLDMAKADSGKLRTMGLVSAAFGVALVWAAKMLA